MLDDRFAGVELLDRAGGMLWTCSWRTIVVEAVTQSRLERGAGAAREQAPQSHSASIRVHAMK
jgi:hypothetical protein